MKQGQRIVSQFAVMVFFLVAFCGTASALDPTDKWEGLIDYAATGASLLDDTCYLQYDMDTGKQSCIPNADAAGKRDFQGDVALSESEAFLGGIPADVHVVKAMLIWIGSVNPTGGEPDNQVTLTPPGGSDFTVVAQPGAIQETTFRNDDANTGVIQNWRYYTYRVDVTDLIRRHHVTDGGDLNGFYKFSNYSGYAGPPYIWNTMAMGGWSLIIIYSDPMADPKRVFYYTDFQYTSNNQIVQTPSGFQVPDEAEAKVTLFISEGDYPLWGMCNGMEDMDSPTANWQMSDGSTYTGTPAELCTDYQGIRFTEGLFFNGEILDDYCFPDAPSDDLGSGLYTPIGPNSENVYNSTINTNLHPSEGACRINTYSVDLDTFDVGSLLNFGDTEATLILSLGGDFIFTNYLILSISTKLPDFDIPGEPEKEASVEAGSALHPGEEFTYYIYVENHGEDMAENVRVRDALPSELEYVANSTVVVEPDGTRRPVADPQPGVAPCHAGISIAAQMPPDPTKRYTVEIGVRLKTIEQGISKETIVSNTAEIISGNGDVYFTNGGVPVTHSVRMESYEGELYFAPGKRNPGDRFVMAGDTSVVLAHINLKVLESPVRLSSFTFTPVDGGDPYMIDAAALYLDTNNDGKLDAGDTLLGEKQQWGMIGMNFADFSAIPSIAPNEQENLLLVVDIASDATPGAYLQFELLEEHTVIQGFAKGLPFKTAAANIPGEDVDLTVELGENNPPAGYLQIGAEAPIMQLKLHAIGDTVTVSEVVLKLEGTIYDPTEVLGLTLIHDANGNGVYDSGEQQLGEQSTPSGDDGEVSFARFFQDIAGDSSEYLLVLGDFSDTIAEEKTFQPFVIESGISTAAVVAGTPVTGSLFSFAEVAYECTSDDDCDPLGLQWSCDLLAGICRYGGGADGDLPDGDDDSSQGWRPDLDGDDTSEEEGDGGGGCHHGGMHGEAGLGLLLLLGGLLYLLLRRRNNQR